MDWRSSGDMDQSSPLEVSGKLAAFARPCRPRTHFKAPLDVRAIAIPATGSNHELVQQDHTTGETENKRRPTGRRKVPSNIHVFILSECRAVREMAGKCGMGLAGDGYSLGIVSLAPRSRSATSITAETSTLRRDSNSLSV